MDGLGMGWDGNLCVLCGANKLLNAKVGFNMGMVVVCEADHCFGVNQTSTSRRPDQIGSDAWRNNCWCEE